jgi:hypothetical protein
LLLACIRVYQAVFAPLMPVGCKFYPSCSHYAYEAIARHGARRGAYLAAARLLRCRPFTRGGYDPVPDDHRGIVPQSEGQDKSPTFAKSAKMVHPPNHPESGQPSSGGSSPSSGACRTSGRRSREVGA